MFSKKATKIDEIITVYLTLTTLPNVKSMAKIFSNFVAFLEYPNFNKILFLQYNTVQKLNKYLVKSSKLFFLTKDFHPIVQSR